MPARAPSLLPLLLVALLARLAAARFGTFGPKGEPPGETRSEYYDCSQCVFTEAVDPDQDFKRMDSRRRAAACVEVYLQPDSRTDMYGVAFEGAHYYTFFSSGQTVYNSRMRVCHNTFYHGRNRPENVVPIDAHKAGGSRWSILNKDGIPNSQKLRNRVHFVASPEVKDPRSFVAPLFNGKQYETYTLPVSAPNWATRTSRGAERGHTYCHDKALMYRYSDPKVVGTAFTKYYEADATTVSKDQTQFMHEYYHRCPLRLDELSNAFLLERDPEGSHARYRAWPRFYTTESRVPRNAYYTHSDIKRSTGAARVRESNALYNAARDDENQIGFPVVSRAHVNCNHFGYRCRAGEIRISRHPKYDIPRYATAPQFCAQRGSTDNEGKRGGELQDMNVFIKRHTTKREVCDDLKGDTTYETPRVFCLANCRGATSQRLSSTNKCPGYAEPGSLQTATPRCGKDERGNTQGYETLSGYCRCTSWRYLGRGCDRPPPGPEEPTNTWLTYIQSYFASDRSESRVRSFCAAHGETVCSGGGICRPTASGSDHASSAYPFTCHCYSGFFGTPRRHEALYNAEFNQACSRYSGAYARVKFVQMDETIRLRQCLFYSSDLSTLTTRFKMQTSSAGWATVAPATSLVYKRGHARPLVDAGCSYRDAYAGPGCRECGGSHRCVAAIPLAFEGQTSANKAECTQNHQCRCIDQALDPTSGCMHKFCAPRVSASLGTTCSADKGWGRCPAADSRPSSRDDGDGTFRYTARVDRAELFTHECECENGFGGKTGDCAEQLCPASRDPVCLRRNNGDTSKCPELMCGGHGTCQLPPGRSPHDMSAGEGQCSCESGWTKARKATNLGTLGTCTWKECARPPGGPADAPLCAGLLRASDPDEAMVGESVCTFDPENPTCMCFANISRVEGTGFTASELALDRYGRYCEHTFRDACSLPGDNGPVGEPCSARGYCYACREQRPGSAGLSGAPRDCAGEENKEPRCHCGTTYGQEPSSSGFYCEVEKCNNGQGCSDDGGTLRCAKHNGKWTCLCREGWGGPDCGEDLRGVSDQCLHYDAAAGRSLVCGGTPSFCRKCGESPLAPNCQGKTAAEHACVCGDSGSEGTYCQLTPKCGAACASQGRCYCSLPNCASAPSTTPSDWYCDCADLYSKQRYLGSDSAEDANCGVDMCRTTGGQPSFGSIDECIVTEATQVWDKARGGCRKLCPAGPTGVECGALNPDGSSRCSVVLCNATETPTCDCSQQGTPADPFGTFRNPDSALATACEPTCLHCRERSPGICDWSQCDEADREQGSGLCRYTQVSQCRDELCPGGTRVDETSCDCPVTGCDNDQRCGPHGVPNAARTACVCPAPLVPTADGRCADPCQNGGTANVTAGRCECATSATGWAGDVCEEDRCTEFGRTPEGACIVYTCLFGGTPNAQTQQCDCPRARSGSPDCAESSCGAHGVPNPDGTVCVCDPGWTGLDCAESFCEDAPAPVLDPAMPHDYRCDCGATRSFDGTRCVADVNDLCGAHGHEYLDVESGGTWTCVCLPGFSGPKCETDDCGVLTNPRVEWDAEAGECRCKTPWANLTAGCTEHVCGIGCPVPTLAPDVLFSPDNRVEFVDIEAESDISDAELAAMEAELNTVPGAQQWVEMALGGVSSLEAVTWTNATDPLTWSVRACFRGADGPNVNYPFDFDVAREHLVQLGTSTEWGCRCPRQSLPEANGTRCIPVCHPDNTRLEQLENPFRPCLCWPNATGVGCQTRLPVEFRATSVSSSNSTSTGEAIGIAFGSLVGAGILGFAFYRCATRRSRGGEGGGGSTGLRYTPTRVSVPEVAPLHSRFQ